jgi:hypothetical protein
MSKIVLIALIISTISCQNFLANPQPQDIGNLVEGFLDGFVLFKGLPHESACIQPTDEIIVNVQKIINIVQHLSNDNIIPSIEGIVSITTNIYEKVKSNIPVCKAWKDEVVVEFQKIGQYVSKDDYMTKLATHLVFGLQIVKDDVTNGVNAWNNGDYSNAGKNFGSAVHFVLFWDLK